MTIQPLLELVLGVAVTITVLLIFATDRLDGDELWKGLAAGGACVASIKAAQAGRYLIGKEQS